MTGVLVALLAVLWAAVLLPVLLRAKENSSVSMTVGSFNRGMRALSSNHSQPVAGGRWVLTPGSPLDQPDPTEIIFRRRRIFCGLLAALAVALPISLIPGLRFMLWVSLALMIGLGGFIAFLLSEKNRRPHRPASVHRPQPERSRYDDVPSVLRMPDRPIRVMHDGKRPVYLIDDEVLAEDDGLSELGWAQAR